MSAGIRWMAAIIGLFALTIRAPAEDRPPIKAAIERGVTYLKNRQNQDGFWKQNDLDPNLPPEKEPQRQVGVTALAGLALLECGVDPTDRTLVKASDVIRDAAPTLQETYSISLALLYLDRLGERSDVPLIESLTVRLLAGQGQGGGWGYVCPSVGDAEVHRLRMRRKQSSPGNQRTGRDLPPEIKRQLDIVRTRRIPPEANTEDNSNTQFATLALWVGRRHNLPVDDALHRVAKHFRDTHNPDGGWDYKLLPMGKRVYPGTPSSGSMACAGLLGLAVAYGLDPSPGRKSRPPRDPNEDSVISAALQFVGATLEPIMSKTYVPAAPAGEPGPAKRFPLKPVNPAGAGNTSPPAPDAAPAQASGTYTIIVPVTYYLWSLARVAMIYDLETVGNRDWYVLGARYFLSNQDPDGGWRLNYRGVVDTSFALLFLQRSNLAGDLTARLKGKVKDPGERTLRSRDVDLSQLRQTDHGHGAADAGHPPAGAASASQGSTGGSSGKDAERLGAELVKAPAEKQEGILAELRDNRGAANTEALAGAIPQLLGPVKQKARDALTERLVRMSPDTLRSKLRDDDAEIRRAAALACVMKQDISLADDLVGLLEDKQPTVSRAAYVALKRLTGQDFGSSPESTVKWKEWLASKRLVAAKTDGLAHDREMLAGTWILESCETAGKHSSRTQVADLRLRFVFAGDKLTLEDAHGIQKTRFELGGGKNLRTMDVVLGKEVILRGIYELNSSGFKICWVSDNGQRPKDFSTTAQGNETLYVFKRP